MLHSFTEKYQLFKSYIHANSIQIFKAFPGEIPLNERKHSQRHNAKGSIILKDATVYNKDLQLIYKGVYYLSLIRNLFNNQKTFAFKSNYHRNQPSGFQSITSISFWIIRCRHSCHLYDSSNCFREDFTYTFNQHSLPLVSVHHFDQILLITVAIHENVSVSYVYRNKQRTFNDSN